jgi:hypothetical protein
MVADKILVQTLEQITELKALLDKNFGSDLTEEEEARAFHLIRNPAYSDKDCPLCAEGREERTIFDTGLCQNHAAEFLFTRKFMGASGRFWY